MPKAHFFDIDTLIRVNNKAWVVDKTNPNFPIMKISRYDFNLIQSGIYRKQNNKIEFNGKTFWMPLDMFNKIKVKAKKYKANLGNLAISLQEFLNKDLINEMDFELNLDSIIDLKNKVEDIYIISSKQTKRNYQSIIDKLELKLREEGILIKSFYFISDNLYDQDSDSIRFKKIRLLIQHLIGYRTDGFYFSDEEITRYDNVYYYDNDYDVLKISDEVNTILEVILSKTDNGLRDVIKEDISEFKPTLYVNKVNENTLNRLETKKVILSLSRLIMKYESFISKPILESKINEQDIHAICERYCIENYTINNGVVDVDGDVNLSNTKLTELPLMFGKVIGDFECDYNNLTSLIGCPEYVGGGFYCGDNELVNLDGCPEYVGINFYCNNNLLTSLIGCPKYVSEYLNCENNELTTLEGGPKEVRYFNCTNNPVEYVFRLFPNYTTFLDSLDYNYFREGNKINKTRLTQALLEIGKDCPENIKGYVWE